VSATDLDKIDLLSQESPKVRYLSFSVDFDEFIPASLDTAERPKREPVHTKCAALLAPVVIGT